MQKLIYCCYRSDCIIHKADIRNYPTPGDGLRTKPDTKLAVGKLFTSPFEKAMSSFIALAKDS